MKGWEGRLEELASWPVEMPWRDVWVLLMRGEHSKGREWAQRHLWAYRLWGWMVALSEDPRTCRTCGGSIPEGAQSTATYCSTACRKRAHRCRRGARPTPFERAVCEADQHLSEVRTQVGYARRWLRRARRSHPDAVLLPPNLATYDHLPGLPLPCRAGCGPRAKCEHTERGICILAVSTLNDDELGGEE